MREWVAVRVMFHRNRVLGTTVAAIVASALVWFGIGGSASGGQHDETSSAMLATEGAPGYTVEDFKYPNADKILAEQNIILKRGDGHITLADCVSGTGQLEIWPREKDKICFRVVGNSGWLTMEIPSVYVIRGNDYTTEVDMTVGSEQKSFDIDQNAWTSVGEGADPGREYLLMEIRSSK